MRKLALCIMLLVSLADAGAAEEGKQNTFSIGSLGFSMEVPVAEGRTHGAYQVAAFLLPASDGFAPNVNVQKQAYEGTIEDYDKLSTGQFTALKLTSVNRTLKKDEVIYEYKGLMQGSRLHWYARALKKGQYVYLVTATALDSQWKDEKKKKKLIDSVNSFKFETKPGPGITQPN